MGAFEGIRPEALFLLAQNRFENSKAFYDAHKDQIRREVLEPLYRLIGDVAPTALKINPDIITDPKRMVCRVRRDTRFTKDKTLYREHIWFFLRHQKNELPTPGFWFEISPSMYNYGCALLSQTPAFLAFWRKNLLADRAGFLRAARPVLKADYELSGERYRRPQVADAPAELRPWLDLKEIVVERCREDIRALSDGPSITEEFTGALQTLAPFYRYLLRLTQAYCAQ